jgi:hypothetical protein
MVSHTRGGKFTEQQTRYWNSNDPRKTSEALLHDLEKGVWCGVIQTQEINTTV